MPTTSGRCGSPCGSAPIGVARVNFSLDAIRALVSRVSLGQTGYGFMLSRKGVYLSYPDESYVRRQKNAFDVARERKTPDRIPIYERSLRGEPTETLSLSGATGRLVWLVTEPIETSDWVFGIDFFTDEVTLDARGLLTAVRRSFSEGGSPALRVRKHSPVLCVDHISVRLVETA